MIGLIAILISIEITLSFRLRLFMGTGNSFGKIFKISTFGESHGVGVGVIVDGCPPRIPLDISDIQKELDRRKPGQSRLTTPRDEEDKVEILSGIFNGTTLGTPIALLVRNKDQRSSDYDEMSAKYRPSHADATYDAKYGVRAIAGGGRSSAREAIGRVAAGAIAKKVLTLYSNVEVIGYVKSVQDINFDSEAFGIDNITSEMIESNIIRCPDGIIAEKMIERIDEIRRTGNSIGGVVEIIARNVPSGIGSPVFDKLEAELAKACLSLPASKGFEIGSGFGGTLLSGYDHNDEFYSDESGRIRTRSNRSGGIQGGISNGENIILRVAFKPTSTIGREQNTVTREGNSTTLRGKGRHDPCVLPRAVPMVEAMVALVLLDALMQQHAQCELFPRDRFVNSYSNENILGFSISGQALEGRPAYLDFQATTPLDPRVLDAMLPYMMAKFGNPHSRTHSFGWETEKAIDNARTNIANLIGASSNKEIIFTSGATESNNMAIKGIARFYKSSTKNHIITTQTEHKCVLDSCRSLESEGFEITYIPVKSNGLIDLQVLAETIRPSTILVSVMGVNNEIGVIQPLKEIGNLCRDKKVFFHSDLAQMAGKLELSVEELKIDVASISSHKIYGPKGIGAIYVRRRPRVRIEPLISGGGQERGLRSGTLAPALCVGFGEAARICKQDMAYDQKWIYHLSEKLLRGVTSKISHVTLNGDPKLRYLGNLNLSFAYVEGESLLMALKNIAVSSGSACTSASLEPSYVLRAIGSDDESAHSSIRFGIGRFTTEAEINLAIELLVKHVERLREMSPLWEMVQDGIDLKTIQWTQDAAHH